MAKTELATLAGGCFWCTEAIFERLKGVSQVVSGYTRGSKSEPNYDQVSSGNTGHVEAIQITYDPQIISYSTLLEVFFKLHDPTTLNKQGHDVGPQYRSAIFYHSDEQQQIAEKQKSKIKDAVTEIVPAQKFFPAESYHQDFYRKNSDQAYCQVVIDPKIQKLYKDFSHLTQ
jgi:peptide-methionine (S)-S-oxide reductase